MELLTHEEILSIVKIYGQPTIIGWSLEDYSDGLIGYLGDHLQLKISIESDGNKSEVKLFVKCMPRFDQWKANYLKELLFFKKEYVMLSSLFKEFASKEGSDKWRPKLIFIKEDLFVFEDVAEQGYRMPHHQYTLTYEEILATVQTVAKFHAQSFIFEERKSKELNRPYSIWEDYIKYLQEPTQGQDWRDTGRNAVIDYLNVYSTHRSKPNFSTCLEVVIPMLFNGAMELMKPSSVYRNVVVHRDLWQNNIFLKKQDTGKMHALIVDYQTVLYTSPMLDISSFLFMNSTREFRHKHTNHVLEFYYEILSNELKSEGIEIDTILDKSTLGEAYEQSLLFGITQAALIVPIVTMDAMKREELFSNPDTNERINTVSRSLEFIDIAKVDENYQTRVTGLFDEIVDRYVFPQKNEQNQPENRMNV